MEPAPCTVTGSSGEGNAKSQSGNIENSAKKRGPGTGVQLKSRTRGGRKEEEEVEVWKKEEV